MITSSDSYNTYDLDKYYVILPQKPVFNLEKFLQKFDAKKVNEGFSYNSEENEHFLSIQEIRDLIKKNLDSNFKA